MRVPSELICTFEVFSRGRTKTDLAKEEEDIRAEWAGREDNDQRIYSGSEVGDPARSKRKPNKLAGR